MTVFVFIDVARAPLSTPSPPRSARPSARRSRSTASQPGIGSRAASQGVALAVVVVMLIVHVTAVGIPRTARFPPPRSAFAIAVWGGVWIAGDRARLRGERMAQLEELARRTARDAERERRLAAAEERTRIARELHDAAGHAINVILVQAGAARLLHERDAAGSRAAITTIEEVARDTIGEIDQLVARAARGRRPARPPPRLAALEELVARHRAAGLDIATEIAGDAAAAAARGGLGGVPHPPGGAHQRRAARRRAAPPLRPPLGASRARADHRQPGGRRPGRATRRRARARWACASGPTCSAASCAAGAASGRFRVTARLPAPSRS